LAWLYFGVANGIYSSKKRVAIVIDDFGGRAGGIEEMMALPYPLTFAMMPFEEFSYQQAEQAKKKGFEIIVHMPFEAVNANPRWYGKKYISAAATPAEIKKLMNEAFQILPMAVGLSNHMGSKATAAPKILEAVFKELQQKNCFYLDSRTTLTASPASTIATGLNLPHTERDVFFRLVPLSKFVFTPVTNRPSRNKNVVIGIDPGHGGIDSGTKSGDMLEKDLNLRFSKTLAAGLKKEGIG